MNAEVQPAGQASLRPSRSGESRAGRLGCLIRRREVWMPTPAGWVILAVLLLAPPALWFGWGEQFLAKTRRAPGAMVLLVESWTGMDALAAASREASAGGYEFVVAAGGATSHRWLQGNFSFAEMGAKELLRAGVPQEKVLAATAPESTNHRTYHSALAAAALLRERAIPVQAVNVFTLGAHARRSRLTFEKAFGEVLGPGIQVGVIGWIPEKEQGMPWWKSTERAKEFLTESAGYAYELLLDGGR